MIVDVQFIENEIKSKLDLQFESNENNVNVDFGDYQVVHDGQNGATFIPHVSDDGVISWTNDKDLENPKPVNVKGDKGDKGDRGEQGIQGVQGIRGEKGADGVDGKDGADGKDGYTPQKGIDYFDGQDGYTPIKGIDYFDGKDGLNGQDGKDGKNGAPGYTPQKGVDYFTKEDKQEIILSVITDGDFVQHEEFDVHTHTASDVGLNNVDNTADSEKNVKHAKTADALSGVNVSTAELNHLSGVSDNIQNQLDSIISMGSQLVINGNAFMGDNTNFSDFEFDGTVANGTVGSFRYDKTKTLKNHTDFKIPVNVGSKYRFEFDAKSAEEGETTYLWLDCHDADGNPIEAVNTCFVAGTTTTLAQDLKKGDTVIHFTSLANWNANAGYANMRIIFWNYKNSFGYTYPVETYSRNVLMNVYENSGVNKTDNTITLITPYNGDTIPAGTPVSQGGGGGYKYLISGKTFPTEWTHYSFDIEGVDYSGLNKGRTFYPATATISIGYYLNHNKHATDNVWFTNFSLKEEQFVNGVGNVNPDLLTKAVPIAKGGTGATTAKNALKALGGASADHTHTASEVGAVSLDGLANIIQSLIDSGAIKCVCCDS